MGQSDGGQWGILFRGDELLVVVADDGQVARDLESAMVRGGVDTDRHAVVEAEDGGRPLVVGQIEEPVESDSAALRGTST